MSYFIVSEIVTLNYLKNMLYKYLRLQIKYIGKKN